MRTLFRGSDRLYHTTTKEFYVVECSGCRLIRLYPWPGPEELQTYYPQNYWFAGDSDTASRLEETYRQFVLRDHIGFVAGALQGVKASAPVLDVGCGGGLFPKLLSERGYRAFGID
jgi:hypothetical protein